MSRPNPFQTFAHCLRFAVRRAAAEGDTFHVVTTGLPHAPRAVLSDRELFAVSAMARPAPARPRWRGPRQVKRGELAPENVEASADPFLPGFGVNGRQ